MNLLLAKRLPNVLPQLQDDADVGGRCMLTTLLAVVEISLSVCMKWSYSGVPLM